MIDETHQKNENIDLNLLELGRNLMRNTIGNFLIPFNLKSYLNS